MSVDSPKFDGKITKWFHFKCFFIKNRPKSTGDIDGFSNIKFNDQKLIEEKVGSGGGTAAVAGKEKVSTKEKKNATQEYSVEYSKSSRAACRSCEEFIAKHQVRISKMEYDSERARSYGPYPGWYHVDCFVAKRESLGWYLPGTDLPGYKSLGVDDQKILKEKIKKLSPPKKRSVDEADGADNYQPTPKKSKADEAALKKQSDKLFSIQKKLETEMTKRQIQEIFEYNAMQIPQGISRLVEVLADAILFGVCDPCPECGNKAFRFKNNKYRCGGDFSEFTSCTYTTDSPKRSAINVPKEFKEEFKFLKGNVGKRIIPAGAAKPTVKSEPTIREKNLPKPLTRLAIVIEDTVQDKEVVRAKVLSFGGKVEKAVTSRVFCVISTQENVNKMTPKIKSAQIDNVPVVSEDFLEKCRKGKVEINAHKLADWGDDAVVAQRLEQASADAAKESQKSGKSVFVKNDSETTMRVKMNGLAAVEPDSGLDGVAKVYQRGKDVYSCVLGHADVARGTNSYYKIQLLESRGTYFVFRAWGRIGTTIGGNKLEEHSTLQDAMLDFKGLFLEKTGNEWENRKNFEKKPKLFNIIEIDYMQDHDAALCTKQILATNSDSKLPLPVQELICLIFDVNLLNQQMKEFEIDLQKLPLGKISIDQISKAYKVLNELQELIDKKGSRLQFLDASNRFFTIIPHDFGMNAPPLLDNVDSIKDKISMLDSLGEMELTMKMLKQEDKTQIPVDHHYAQLKTEIDVVSRNAPVFGLLQKYVSTTHATTHSSYELEIMDVFTVARQGEAQRYKPFKRLQNRRLLWHGSRLSNFAGILSQGLRIAPPEAPVTGYMFGKGIYFADMVSKSANYCCTSPSNPMGILLLCEVALGAMYECTQAEYITKLPDKKHSTKGIGMTEPQEEEMLDGVVVPMGPTKKSSNKTSLLYNEYVVYDVAQVQIKYLLKVNFKYKY
ncbi:poly [ADP-ribose] polymerase-like isoform X2 [Varroa destructor]|uniref:Poly [ADP-ribose] polymerase n=1 Tax=Varroa destructor TaxID=109461 RepID=A0A7M7JFT6_VARDE|nr:poly [ADP-ribose] polymerase-like isoform X2 [Varroa destructor]